MGLFGRNKEVEHNDDTKKKDNHPKVIVKDVSETQVIDEQKKTDEEDEVEDDEDKDKVGEEYNDEDNNDSNDYPDTPKDIQTGKGYKVAFEGVMIRILTLTDGGDSFYKNLDEHLMAGFIMNGQPYRHTDDEDRVVLLKPKEMIKKTSESVT